MKMKMKIVAANFATLGEALLISSSVTQFNANRRLLTFRFFALHPHHNDGAGHDVVS
jgi:hypothetical protein